MLRVANLCAELSNRNKILITFWTNASKAVYHRNTEISREKTIFYELLNKIISKLISFLLLKFDLIINFSHVQNRFKILDQ